MLIEFFHNIENSWFNEENKGNSKKENNKMLFLLELIFIEIYLM